MPGPIISNIFIITKLLNTRKAFNESAATPAKIQVTRSNKTNNSPQQLQTSEDLAPIALV
jgi:hypothetical protein